MPLFRFSKRLQGNESGVTLIETVISLAILGLIAVAFISSVANAAKATSVADERATAESIARSQMEYVKTLPYVPAPTAYAPADLPSGEDYSNYSVTIDVEPVHATDDGIQEISVTVSHGDKLVLTVVGYKVDR